MDAHELRGIVDNTLRNQPKASVVTMPKNLATRKDLPQRHTTTRV
jgi:hypothetical protein